MASDRGQWDILPPSQSPATG
jgi:hypothetical protein